MANYWKSMVLPKIKKVFENPKKTAAAEACKVFEVAKEQYLTECEEKKTELQPKVIEIYEASPPEMKTLIKTPKDSSLKKNSAAVQKFLDELAKIEFPGSKPICEAATNIGPGYLPGPIFFLFQKISTYIPEEKKEEAAPSAEVVDALDPEKTEAETSCIETKEKEIVVEATAEPLKIEEPGRKVDESPAAECAKA